MGTEYFFVRLDSCQYYDSIFSFAEKCMARDRLREPEARILALRIAASRPNREASTTFIKEHIPNYIELTDIDLMPSPTRHQEERWQQIVGNVISHIETTTSIFSRGFAERTEDGIRVTDLGLKYLAKLGF